MKLKTSTKLSLFYILLIIIILLLIVGCSPLKFIESTIKKEEPKKEISYPTKEEVAEEKAVQDQANIIACIKLQPECESEW